MSFGPFTTCLVGFKNAKILFWKDITPEVIEADFSRPNVGATSGSTVWRNGINIELAENDPDFNEPQAGGCSSLLLRPEARNLAIFPKDFTNAVWAKANAGTGVLPIITANAGVSPDGTMNADRVQLNRGAGTTGGDVSFITQAFTGLTNPHTGTIFLWIKSFDGTDQSFSFYSQSSGVTQVTANSEWQLVKVTATRNDVNDYLRLGSLGNVDPQTADILVSQAMFKINSLDDAFIPSGATPLTRASNAFTFSDLISKRALTATEGTIKINIRAEALVRFNNAANIQIGTTGNRILIFNNSPIAARPSVLVETVDGLFDYLLTADFSEIGIVYKVGQVLVSVNGSTVLNLATNLDLSGNSTMVVSGIPRPIDIEFNGFTPLAISEAEINSKTTS
tara:strand:+ start:1755 stop:2936 length:1182 start_codon:yes stop_codon:yes gene_type:complete